MNLSVIYHGNPIGAASLNSDGIFWDFSCRLQSQINGPIRLYALCGWESEYLGIPAADGVLHIRMPKKHLPDGADVILASQQPNGIWKPWAGEIDGVRVETALIRHKDGIQIALESGEAIRFPEWIETMKKVQVFDSERLLLQLDESGNLPEIEKTIGGNNNETMDRNAPAVELPSDASSVGDDYGIGGYNRTEQGWQADSPDF